MNVFFSTVVRSAPLERGGEVVKLDWARKRVVATRPIVPTDPVVTDPNPRGGTRGGRGILIGDGEVLVASYHSIHVFDENLQREVRRITNPLFANLHELAWDGNQIWTACTAIDAAIKVESTGAAIAAWWPREDLLTASRFGLAPLAIDKRADNRLRFLGASDIAPGHVHLNAIALNGPRPLVLLNRNGAVVALDPTEVLIERTDLRGSHNLLVTRCGRLIIANTLGCSVDVFDLRGRLEKRIELDRFRLVKKILRRFALKRLQAWLAVHGRPSSVFYRLFGHVQMARPVFVRGLSETPTGTILVGISPAAVLEIDWKTGRLVDAFSYSDDVRVCIHGLAWSSRAA